MKTISFNQLQFRIFFILIFLFSGLLGAYRFFIQQPQLATSLIAYSERELSSLKTAIFQLNQPFATLNYDYSIWTDTYKFITQDNEEDKQEYIEDNYLDDTFLSLKIDGVFIFDKQFNPLFTKGLNHQTNQPLKFNFFDLNEFPHNKAINPQLKNAQRRLIDTEVANTFGTINTLYGPAFYYSTEILKSDKTGPAVGFLVFVRLLNDSFAQQLSQLTLTTVEVSHITTPNQTDIPKWDETVPLTALTPTSERLLVDPANNPLIKITLNHTNQAMPSLWSFETLMLILSMIMLSISVYFILGNFVIQPVKQLALNIEEMDKAKAYKALPKDFIITELLKLSTHFNALMDTVNRQNALLNEQVFVDELTRISNRRAFERFLETHMVISQRQGFNFSIIMADIDQFKAYNDHFGHLAGDEAITIVAQTLNSFFPRKDEMCARYGGEEFIILFNDTNITHISQKLDVIINKFAELNIDHPQSSVASYLTVSFGVCVVKSQPSDQNQNLTSETIIDMADKALYQAKEKGRNQYNINTIPPDAGYKKSS
ncbi:sensor domain-containing diguanylate cyclase [Shewanella gaetbuli]